jgi:hypothetical protein
LFRVEFNFILVCFVTSDTFRVVRAPLAEFILRRFHVAWSLPFIFYVPSHEFLEALRYSPVSSVVSEKTM